MAVPDGAPEDTSAAPLEKARQAAAERRAAGENIQRFTPVQKFPPNRNPGPWRFWPTAPSARVAPQTPRSDGESGTVPSVHSLKRKPAARFTPFGPTGTCMENRFQLQWHVRLIMTATVLLTIARNLDSIPRNSGLSSCWCRAATVSWHATPTAPPDPRREGGYTA